MKTHCVRSCAVQTHTHASPPPSRALFTLVNFGSAMKWKATSVSLSTWSHSARAKGLLTVPRAERSQKNKTQDLDCGPQSQKLASCDNIQSSRNSNRTAENKLSLCRKVEIFLNSTGASRSLFLSDVFLCFNRFHLVPVWSVLAVTAECAFRSELCVYTSWWMAACWLCTATEAKHSHAQLSYTNTAFPAFPALPAHRPQTSTGTQVWAGIRPSTEVVRQAEFPVGRAPSQLTITLTVAQKTNHSVESVQRNQEWLSAGFPHKTVRSLSHLVSWPVLTTFEKHDGKQGRGCKAPNNSQTLRLYLLITCKIVLIKILHVIHTAEAQIQ